jgi:PIN domain nuclease of toxin-antitoxin system
LGDIKVIVLDTHVWVWFVSNPELLSKAAQKAIDAAMEQEEICVSSISAWEVALLVAKGRLKLTLDVADWIARSERLPFFQFMPIDNSVAVKSVALPQPLHNDPADRIIIATAITIGAPVVTKDEKILDYPHVTSIW